MAQINTEWDYELKEEVFRVSADKGYTHKTFTSLKKKSTTSSVIGYFTATFEVNVEQDIGNSYIVIYDNNHPIPFTIGGTEYTQYSWGQNTTAKTFSVKLGYDVDHNIVAKYHGNGDGLPSKSLSIPIHMDLPESFNSSISRTNSTVQFNKGATINLPLTFSSGKKASTTLSKTVKIYVDEVLNKTVSIQLTSGNTTGTLSTNNLTGSLSEGKHNIRCVFEGDDYNDASSLSFDIMVGYNIQIIKPTPLELSQTPPPSTVYITYESGEDHIHDEENTITARVLNWNGEAKSGVTVTRYNDGVSATGVTDSHGDVSFICDTGVTDFYVSYQNSTTTPFTLPCAIIEKVEIETSYTQVIEDVDNNVSVEVVEFTWLDNGAISEEEEEVVTPSLEGITVVVEDNKGNEYVTEVKDNGTASVNIPTQKADTQPTQIDTTQPVEEKETDMEITAKTGGVGATTEVEEVWEFLSTKNKEINPDYEILGGMGSLLKLTKGYRFKATKDPKAKQYGCRVGFGTGATEIGDYQIIFKSVESVKNVICRAGGWRNRNGKVTYDRPQYSQKMYFAPNSTYIISRVGNHLNITRKGVGTVLTSQITTNGEPMLELIYENESDAVILDDIKIKEL